MSSKFNWQNKAFRTVLAVLILLVILAAVVFVSKAYPAASVGGEFISARQINTSYEIAKKLDAKADKVQVYNQVIKIKQEEQLLRKFGITNTSAFNDEENFYKTGNEAQYKKFVKDYFSGNEMLFNQYVVAPLTYDTLLRIKYNEEIDANITAYNKAQAILAKLSSGESFEDLAKTNSDDKVSAQVGGDLGFLSQGQILPELEKKLEALSLKEREHAWSDVIVSRQGYHILYPVEAAQKDGHEVWHLKHILIQTQGYENWLANQLKLISVHRFINI